MSKVSRLLPSGVTRDVAILMLIVFAAAMPFLNQPFHMDDNFYMDMARNVAQRPLFPNHIAYIFEGKLAPHFGAHSHPPFQTYFLALLQYLAGEGPGREWIYHACALVFPFLAVIALYFLSAQFLARPIWPALLLACSPVFLVMQHTLMTDVPTLAFWLVSITAFVRATETKSKIAYIVSSISQFAAMFASYHSLALLPLLGFYHFRKRNSMAGWLALLSPVVLIGAWFAVNCLHYHRFLLADTAGFVQSKGGWHAKKLAIKFAALVQYQGWLIAFPVLLFYAFARGFIRRILFLAAMIVACGAWFAVPQYDFLNKCILLIGAVAGLAILFHMAGHVIHARNKVTFGPDWTHTEDQFLWLWYFGVLAYCLVIFPDGSARYILPLVPPVLIMLCRQFEIRIKAGTMPRAAAVLCASVAVSGAWGLVLSHADTEFASVYPRAARDFRAIAGPAESYYGGEWGFRYYFAQAGVQQLNTGPGELPSSGWLVRPRLALPYELDKSSLDLTVPVRRTAYAVATPVRLLDWSSPAGFYSTYWGKLPFSLSWAPLEVMDIRQINYLARELPAASVQSESRELPQPGRMTIDGKNLAAILLMPGTRITYPVMDLAGLVLQVKCGISPNSYAGGEDCGFEFKISWRDLAGRFLDSSCVVLQPGLRQADRTWRLVQVNSGTRSRVFGCLELGYYTSCKDRHVPGAFAEPLLFGAARDAVGP